MTQERVTSLGEGPTYREIDAYRSGVATLLREVEKSRAKVTTPLALLAWLGMLPALRVLVQLTRQQDRISNKPAA